MANLVQNSSGLYSIRFRLGSQRFNRSLETTSEREAKEEKAKIEKTIRLAHVVEANTLLSGLGFKSAGLASAHSIHNGLTRLPATHDYFHGEKVAIGVLAGLFLTNRPSQIIREVYEFCESVGLPTALADIGIPDANDAELRIVAEAACGEGETIHHEPCPISADAVLAALKTADRFGRSRRSDGGRSPQ